MVRALKCATSSCCLKGSCERYSFKGLKSLNVKVSLYEGGTQCKQYVKGNKWTV